MTSSSNPPVERCLDTMLIVYSLLQGHPASFPCEQFIRNRSGWITTSIAMLEAYAILTKVYGVDHVSSAQKLAVFASSPLAIASLDSIAVFKTISLAQSHQVDLTDAALLYTATTYGANWIATEDQQLSRVSLALGIAPESPMDHALRQQVAGWEAANLAPKGLSRVLQQIHHWLIQCSPQVGQLFWNQTGNGSHLP